MKDCSDEKLMYLLATGSFEAFDELYHAVIATIPIWICIMAFQQKKPIRQEVNTTVHDSNLAAINNSTLLPSIQTCIIRK